MAGKRLAAFTVFALLALALALLTTSGREAQAQVDTDNDGFSDMIETYLGTDPLDNCPNVIGAHDAWPLDINMDTYVSVVGDILLNYRGNIGLPVGGDPILQRLDLNGDGWISIIGDLLLYAGMPGTRCDGGTFHLYTWPGTPVTVGIDPEITGNSASTLGDLEACVRVDVDPGDFGDGTADHTIDVYVSDAEDLYPNGYDAWVAYDPDRVDPVSWDDLIKLPGAMGFTAKMPSQLNAAAAYFDPEDSGIPGDGTLVRIHLDAKSAGAACFGFGFAKAYSSVTVVHPAVTRAASLVINEDCPTDDSDGDSIIDMCDNCQDLSNPGQEDYDGDGWGDDCDNCRDLSNPGQENDDGDEWGNACDNCPTTPTKWYVPLGDEDCDGFTTTVEVDIGTDPDDACTDNPGVHDAWPLDVNIDTWVTVGGDVLPYRGRIGATGGPPPEGNWSQRLDLNMDNWITVGGDVLPFRGMIGEQCT